MDYIIYSILFLVLLWTLRGKPLIKKIPPTAWACAVESEQGLSSREEIK